MCSHYTTGPVLSFVARAVKHKHLYQMQIVTNLRCSRQTPFNPSFSPCDAHHNRP